VGPETTKVPQILGNLDITPAGGTPTAAALKAAADYFTTGAGMALAGEKYVLLATDGGPNGNGSITCNAMTCTANIDRNTFTNNYCNPMIDPNGSKNCLDDTGSVDQLSAMTAAGIKTFVVAFRAPIFRSAPTPRLDGPVAGGVPALTTAPRTTPCPPRAASRACNGCSGDHEAATEPMYLQLLQSNPPDLKLLNVYVDGKPVPQGGADGWTLDTSTSPPTVVLQGMPCSNIEMNGAMSIQILYGCPTIIVN
jgi:hypothetical protein